MPPRQRIFAYHFDRLALFVADAFQMLNQIFEGNLFASAQVERELAIKIGAFNTVVARRRPARS